MILCGVLFMWLTAFAGCIAMKKISPEIKWYPPYAFGVCVLATIVIAGIYAA